MKCVSSCPSGNQAGVGKYERCMFCHALPQMLEMQPIKKQRHYFADKGPSRQAMVFPVVMYGCESWTIKKTECQRIDALELWSWRRLLRVPWTARRSNQSILKEINSEYSLEGLMLRLKHQSFSHLMGRADSLEKTLMLGETEGRRRRGRQRMRWLDGITDNGHEIEQTPGDSEGQGSLACCSPWGCKEVDMTEQLSNDNSNASPQMLDTRDIKTTHGSCHCGALNC